MTNNTPTVVLHLRKENGKAITCERSGEAVALIVWAKNGSPKLPLVLTKEEAKGLQTLLAKATGAAA